MSEDEQEALAERFRQFGERECRGSSPLYRRLSLAAARDPEVLGLLAAARGPQRRPNLLFAAVHYLLLQGDPHPLAASTPAWVPSALGAIPGRSSGTLCCRGVPSSSP